MTIDALPACHGLLGKVFGHNFKPRYSREPNKETYVDDVCVRCGMTAVRVVAAPPAPAPVQQPQPQPQRLVAVPLQPQPQSQPPVRPPNPVTAYPHPPKI